MNFFLMIPSYLELKFGSNVLCSDAVQQRVNCRINKSNEICKINAFFGLLFNEKKINFNCLVHLFTFFLQKSDFLFISKNFVIFFFQKWENYFFSFGWWEKQHLVREIGVCRQQFLTTSLHFRIISNQFKPSSPFSPSSQISSHWFVKKVAQSYNKNLTIFLNRTKKQMTENV